jgi:hypothetical protein
MFEDALKAIDTAWRASGRDPSCRSVPTIPRRAGPSKFLALCLALLVGFSAPWWRPSPGRDRTDVLTKTVEMIDWASNGSEIDRD